MMRRIVWSLLITLFSVGVAVAADEAITLESNKAAIDLIQEHGLKIKYIICTHAHFDHIAAISELKEETRANIIIHKDDLDFLNVFGNFPKQVLSLL